VELGADLSSQSHQSTAAAGDAPLSSVKSSANLSYTSRWSELCSGLSREPLLHFLVLGALIFAIHAAVTPSISKERLIEVTPEVRQSIIDLFKINREGREPNPDELAPLIDLWILNEITYREALALGLDKGDDMIRERIATKMRLLIFGNLKVPDPTEDELREWYEARRSQYDIPDVIGFYELPIGGAEAEEEARAILQQIETGNEPEAVRLRAHIFPNRPRHSLEPAFGKTFVDALAALPVGKWEVLQSQAGWHIVRVDSFRPGRKVELGEVQTQVIARWKDERGRLLGTAAVRDLGKSYVIRRGEP
jgi:parvulin-like peptidyl-prolyl cis-trans isomerase-like protein